jgi:hypothetical protein
MFSNSIDSKPLFQRSDGANLRDLTASMFDMNNNNFTGYNLFRVPRDYRMRPDLISKAVYNNSAFAEIILKYNGISNPFSIDEGDVILIPSLDSVQQNIKKNHTVDSDGGQSIRNSYKYIDPTKIPKKDKELQQFDTRQLETTVNGAQQGTLPPNISDEGVSQLTYRNGRVYFGQNAETCLQNGTSTSEFLTKVINSKT